MADNIEKSKKKFKSSEKTLKLYYSILPSLRIVQLCIICGTFKKNI
jgi:hypothetical protein